MVRAKNATPSSHSNVLSQMAGKMDPMKLDQLDGDNITITNKVVASTFKSNAEKEENKNEGSKNP